MALAILLAVFLIDGCHNNGQPSAQSGPGNVMRTDQGGKNVFPSPLEGEGAKSCA